MGTQARVVDRRLAALPERLRAARVRRGWTLERAADHAGLSLAHLSRLESGGRQPSIAVLVALATAYGEPIGGLLGDDQPPPTGVVRGRLAPVLESEGLSYASLTAHLPDPLLQALRVRVPAGRARPGRAQHRGEEWLFVRSGRLRLDLDDEETVLEPGDAAHFDAAVPHRLGVDGRDDVELLLVAAATRGDVLAAHR